MGEKLNKNKHTCPKELLQLKNNLQQLVLYLYRYLPVCAYQHCVDTKAGAISLSLCLSVSLSDCCFPPALHRVYKNRQAI